MTPHPFRRPAAALPLLALAAALAALPRPAQAGDGPVLVEQTTCDPIYSPCAAPDTGPLPPEDLREIQRLKALEQELSGFGAMDSSATRPETYVPSEVLMRDGSFTRSQLGEHRDDLRQLLDYHEDTGRWPGAMLDAGYHPDAVEQALDRLDSLDRAAVLRAEHDARTEAETQDLDLYAPLEQFDEDSASNYDHLTDEEFEALDFLVDGREPGETFADALPGPDLADPGAPAEAYKELDPGEFPAGDAYEELIGDDYPDPEPAHDPASDTGSETGGDAGNDGGDIYDPQGLGPDGAGDFAAMTPEELRAWAEEGAPETDEGEDFAELWSEEAPETDGSMPSARAAAPDTGSNFYADSGTSSGGGNGNFYADTADAASGGGGEISGCSQADAERYVGQAMDALGPQPAAVGASANYVLRKMKVARDATRRFHARCQRSDMTGAVGWWETEIRKFEDWMRSAGIAITN